MKYIDGFRDSDAAKALAHKIREAGSKLGNRTVRIMEVCGSHTMAIGRYGIRDVLPDNVELISGPGCPVCVTPAGYIDAAISLAAQGKIIVTFGDMLNVPGSVGSLAESRASGHRIEICYSPSLAADIAAKEKKCDIIFLAIGFETTIGPVINLIDQAIKRNLDNLYLLTSFKLIPPAMEMIVKDPELAIDGFLCPAHVSAVIGSNAYLPIAEKYGKACVVAGFEPLDILFGILKILDQVIGNRAEVDNQYSRVVKPEGNRVIAEVIEKYLVPCDSIWRGLGKMAGSGMKIRDAFSSFDAAGKFGIDTESGEEPKGCLCGQVLSGKIKPNVCSLFAVKCTPESPVGPCMVSSEGTCAAFFKYEMLKR